MRHKMIEYFDGEQKLISQLFAPDDNEQHPGVIIFPAFEGLAEFATDYAKKLAEKGFVVLAADIYGDGSTSDTIEGCFELISPFLAARDLVRRRSVLAFEQLKQQDNVDIAKIGAVGFCFGGMCVLELARSGANLNAGVTMHGVLAKSDLPTESIKAKLLILHGYQDPQAPPKQLFDFADEMKAAGVHDWTFAFFGEAMHSYTDPKTGTFDPNKEKEMGRKYDPVAAKRSFHYALDFFREHLLEHLRN